MRLGFALLFRLSAGFALSQKTSIATSGQIIAHIAQPVQSLLLTGCAGK